MTLRTDVSALYIDRLGPYPKLVADCWDEARDAFFYDGPNPVVAHPPCGPWSSLRHLSHADQDERDCGPRAVEQVRQFGGVLEQPAGSRLWACGLPPVDHPFEIYDDWDGFSIEIEQVAWGHVARKRTWLYLVVPDRERVLAAVRTGGAPTHWCSGTHTPRQRGTVPPGIKVCSAQQRRRTPVAFAEWLIELAASARQSSRVA